MANCFNKAPQSSSERQHNAGNIGGKSMIAVQWSVPSLSGIPDVTVRQSLEKVITVYHPQALHKPVENFSMAELPSIINNGECCLHPIAPVRAQRTSISLWDFLYGGFNTSRRYFSTWFLLL